MRKLVVAGILVVALLGLLSAVAFSAAPDTPGDVYVTAQVEKSVWLSVTDDQVLLIAAPEGPALGGSDTDAQFSVKANWNWTLQAEAMADPDGFDFTGTAGTIPASSVLVEGSGADGTVSIDSGGSTGGTTVNVTYAPNFQWTDAPGSYDATHTYTLAFQ
ncbi:MAG: hypothetical protein ACYCX3_10560 [Thermoleophilia bacterium]